MDKIIRFEELRKKRDSRRTIESDVNIKKLYEIDCDEDEFAMKLRAEKREEKGLQ